MFLTLIGLVFKIDHLIGQSAIGDSQQRPWPLHHRNLLDISHR